MKQSPSQRHSADLREPLDTVLIHSGLAELVPRDLRGQAPLLFRAAMLVLCLVGLVGLPLGGVLLVAVLSIVVESVDYRRQQFTSLTKSLARSSFWTRIRPPFYWTMAAGIGICSLLLGGESFWAGMARGTLQWLCLRAIADSVKYPDRYNSVDGFLDWAQRLWHHGSLAMVSWFTFTTLAVTAAFVLNVGVPGIWRSVGNTDWDRLLAFGSFLCLIAYVAFLRSSGSAVASTVQENVQRWEGLAFKDLGRVLKSVQLAPRTGVAYSKYTDLLEEELKWKNVDNLVSRVASTLVNTLAERVRWSGVLVSVLIFLLGWFFLATSAFLIIPRDVMADWASAGQDSESRILFAFGDMEELISDEFLSQILEIEWSDFSQEPLPKLAFLEAVVIACLIVLQTAADRPAIKRIADMDPWNTYRWLLLGTAYLILLEGEFQYLYGGFATRQLTGKRAFRVVTIRNDVLLAQSVATKASVYRAISAFLRVYAPREWRSSPHIVCIFSSQPTAQEWAMRFLRFSSLTRTQPADLEKGKISLEPGQPSSKFWLWSGDQLLALTSLEEAQWYGRFVGR